ncbi:MAG: acyltransferase [Bacteroidales bacterium]|nr:acyltransferase [Bacteroidales bacterium]
MKIFKLIFNVNWIKSIFFNFRYLKLSQAIKLPILIFNNTLLYKVKGKIIINAPIETGLVKIGPHNVGTKDVKSARTIWECYGNLVINGKTTIGSGSSISIGKNAILTFGKDFSITGNSSIICQKEITFGDNCLLSWDIQILDSDFHKIYNIEGKHINKPKPIVIGNKCWIGARCTILKGVNINDNTIIAANSTITKSFEEKNIIIGNNNDTRIIKKRIRWEI